MKKLLEFGRIAMFYFRVITGYEERRIRSYRLEIEQRLRSAQEAKEAVKKVPEQLILTEVRNMVEGMQNLNKKMEEMEADINNYFKPIDKEVEAIINTQMDKEKARIEMMGNLYKHAMVEKAVKEAAEEVRSANKAKMEMMEAMSKQALLEEAEAQTTKRKQPLTKVRLDD